jgi:hypothetical protein
MFDSFKLTESRTDNPDVLEFVDDVVGPPGSPASSFDLVFPTQTAFPEISGLKIEHDVIEFSPDQARTWMATAMAESGGQTGVSRGNAVATESLEIAHEGFEGQSEAVTWTAIAMAESDGSVGSYGDCSLHDLIV